MHQQLAIHGHALLTYRHPDGSEGWTRTLKNGVTLEGIAWLLNLGFRNGSNSPAIYAGLITLAGYVTNSPNDMHSSHPGWSEFTGYAGSNRPVWTPSPANSGNIGTITPARFTFTSSGNIKGAFLSTIQTAGSLAAGVLYNTAIAIAAMPVSAGGQLDVSFSVSLGG